MAEFIYQMEKVRKAYDGKVILDDVTTWLLPRRQHRRRGPQRHGQVDPAQDHGRDRGHQQRRGAPLARLLRGILLQEPPLDETKTVKQNIEMAFGDIIAKVNRFNRSARRWATPTRL